ncbi:transposase [Patescibacteria group bacterium]|nr:transposase [Patescibacteria group bacterium]
MFRKNEKHLQTSLFSFQETLPSKQREQLYSSEEYNFYKIVFCNIKEDIFKCLYSEKESRPNAPINSMVSALILKERKDWSYTELFHQIAFNLLIKTAVGLNQIDEMPFCSSTLFYFQNKLDEHYVKTGENLLEKVFDTLTGEQLKKLGLKTEILGIHPFGKRTDSFLAASNIRNYSRLQLLIEVLLRMYRVMSEEDQKRFKEILSDYTYRSSNKYIYDLKSSELPRETEKIGDIYYRIFHQIKEDYKETKEFRIFSRAYKEHFKEEKEKIVVKKGEELKSSCLQSPDDEDATYREKNETISKGQSINIVETANPVNPIELINDICVESNNTNDDKILNKRIEKIKEKTPKLNEIHSDGAFGSEENDKLFDKLNITHVQTAIKGRKPGVEIIIEKDEEGNYQVSCPFQKVEAVLSAKKYKAEFELDICQECKFAGKCSTIENNHFRTYNFTKADYLKNKRHNAINNIPKERKYLRNNVEATVSEFKRKFHNGKLKVRGYFKTTLFAFSMAISINFGRIFRFLKELSPNTSIFDSFWQYFLLNRWQRSIIRAMAVI